MVKYWPKVTPVEISLPFSARGSNTIASSVAYKTIYSRIFLANFSYLEFISYLHTFMQNSENVRAGFSAMEHLGKVKLIISGNSTVEFKWIGLNMVKVICIDNSRAGFFEFDIKDLVLPDFIPYCKIFNGPYSNMGVKQMGFCDENSHFDMQAWLDGLTTKSSNRGLDKILANTDPIKMGYNSNLQVYMQSNISYDNPIYSGESSRGDLVQNSGTKRSRAESPIGDIGDESIQVKALNLDEPTVSLKFDINKLYPFTENNTIEWKIYLERICTDVRVACIDKWGLDMVEKATINNILIDYENPTEQGAHFRTLWDAIKRATGDCNIKLDAFFLLSSDFIESLDTKLNDIIEELESEYSESEDASGITENSNSINVIEPLTGDAGNVGSVSNTGSGSTGSVSVNNVNPPFDVTRLWGALDRQKSKTLLARGLPITSPIRLTLADCGITFLNGRTMGDFPYKEGLDVFRRLYPNAFNKGNSRDSRTNIEFIISYLET